jgi:hypothetical protein
MAKKPGDPGYDPAIDGADTSSALTSNMNSKSLFSDMPSGDNLNAQAERAVSNQLSGKAYDPYETSAQEAMAAAAQNLYSNIGSQFGPAIGQGSAVGAKSAVDQSVLSNLSKTNLGIAQGREETKTSGLSAYNQLKATQLAEKTSNQNDLMNQYNAAVDAGSFDTAASIFQQMTGKVLDTRQLKTAQDFKNALSSAQVKSAGLGNTALEQSIGTDKYNAIQNMVNTGATIDQINNQFGAGTINQSQYDSMRAASDTTFRLSQLAANTELAKLGIASSEKIAGMNISSNENIAHLQIDSAERLAKDKNWLDQQGINLQSAAFYGYDDANGNHVMGSSEIAAKRFGLESDTLELQREELTRKYDLLSAEDKRAADSFYGYDTTDESGNTVHHLGSADLAAKAADIQAQGLSLEEAQLKGYTDPATGEHIKGNLETAAESLGLQSKTVAAQTAEAYANIENMNADQQNKVKQLYGYTDPATGKHIEGSLELNAKQVNETLDNLRRQTDNEIAQTLGTLSLQERQVKIQEASAESTQYWDTANAFVSYAQTHLDAKPTDPAVVSQAARWYEAQFGVKPDINSATFKTFAENELKAANDSRLTNPIDQSIYEVNSSNSLTDSEKEKFVAVLKALPVDTKFKTDENGNVVVASSSSDANNSDFTFDETNTNPSQPSMFAEGGNVWIGDGRTQALREGQRITLGTNFGIQNSSNVIPQGNYTAVSADQNQPGHGGTTSVPVTLLQSEDGGKYYLTSSKTGQVPGYSYHSDGGYYTKD